MKLNKKNINRLGIFVFFDKDGIVDNYVLYLLDDIKKNLKDIIIVCNGNLTEEGKRKLSNYTDELYLRKNEGFDVGAWKDAILNYVGPQRLKKYDELVLFNDTFYGPFYPFSKIFNEMNNKDIDFWGITNHPESIYDGFKNGCDVNYNPEFIQRYFTVFRNSIIKEQDFIDYWKSIPDKLTYQDAVHLYEVSFAKKLSDIGYKWDTYIDNSVLNDRREQSICYNTFMPFTMITERRLPILIKKIFYFDPIKYINSCGGEEPRKCLEYIDKQTKYDINLILENLIRICNISDLKQSLHLNYILPTNFSNYNIKENKKIAVIIHLYYIDMLENLYKYVKEIPQNIDIFITTSSENKKEKILNKFSNLKNNKLEVRLVNNRGRDIAALLIGCRDIFAKYEYVCFTHDKKSSKGNPLTVGKSFQYTILENVLKSEDYILNIMELFEKNPKLGIVSPPAPLHANYFGTIGNEWTICYEETEKLLDKLNIKCNISQNKQPFILGTSFWCRTKSLKPLFDYEWKNTDFPEEPLAGDGTISHAIERCFPYIAQSQGFYSGWVMTEEYSSLEIQNLYLLTSNILTFEQNKLGISRIQYPEHFFHLLKSKREPTTRIFNSKALFPLRYGIKVLRKIKSKIILYKNNIEK